MYKVGGSERERERKKEITWICDLLCDHRIVTLVGGEWDFEICRVLTISGMCDDDHGKEVVVDFYE